MTAENALKEVDKLNQMQSCKIYLKNIICPMLPREAQINKNVMEVEDVKMKWKCDPYDVTIDLNLLLIMWLL